MARGQERTIERETSTDLLYPVSDEKSTCLKLNFFFLLLTPSVSSDNCLEVSIKRKLKVAIGDFLMEQFVWTSRNMASLTKVLENLGNKRPRTVD